MNAKNTPRHAADQDHPNRKLRKLINLGEHKMRRRRQDAEVLQPDTDPRTPKLQPGTTLGYFVEHFKETLVFQVEYGSEQNVWVKAALIPADTPLPPTAEGYASFFRQLARYHQFKQFALIGWRNGITSFAYNGDQLEPSGLALHSPEEAVIQHKALLLYWHFTKGYVLHSSDELWLNPNPEYVNLDDGARTQLT